MDAVLWLLKFLFLSEKVETKAISSLKPYLVSIELPVDFYWTTFSPIYFLLSLALPVNQGGVFSSQIDWFFVCVLGMKQEGKNPAEVLLYKCAEHMRNIVKQNTKVIVELHKK